MAGQRETWASGRGFVLATIGAAVGLGNIWRFSYVAGENGGGAFLLVYFLSVLLVGAPLLVAELALGRRAGGDGVSAFTAAGPRSPWRWAGWLGVAAAFLILSYYAIIAGWALKYLLGAATGALWRAAGEGYGGYFARFIGDPGQAIAWQMAMLAAAMLVVAGGVQRGIEAVNRVLMPILAFCIVALAAYAATLPGAAAGWAFLFKPDWAALMKGSVLVAALGQAFFSIGLGMAIFVTYGSYMTRKTSIGRSAAAIIVGDTLFAVVAGLAIFPAVFAFGMDPQAGPQLAFITLPQIFLAMPGGRIVGLVFFALLVAAALTSMAALLEVPVATLVHRSRLRRWGAVALVGAAVFVTGLPSAMSYGLLAEVTLGGLAILDVVDRSVSNYLLPLSGLSICVYIGWCWPRARALDSIDARATWLPLLWLWLVRLVSPTLIVLILLDSLGVL